MIIRVWCGRHKVPNSFQAAAYLTVYFYPPGGKAVDVLPLPGRRRCGQEEVFLAEEVRWKLRQHIQRYVRTRVHQTTTQCNTGGDEMEEMGR